VEVIIQRSIEIHLQPFENPNRRILDLTSDLPGGYIVRVCVNGIRPLEYNANCLRGDLKYSFEAGTGNTPAVDEWYALAGGDVA
jgi:hypothetical protein